MLWPDLRDVRVYLHRAPVDMRKQRNGLGWLLEGYDVMKMKPHQALEFSHAS